MPDDLFVSQLHEAIAAPIPVSGGGKAGKAAVSPQTAEGVYEAFGQGQLDEQIRASQARIAGMQPPPMPQAAPAPSLAPATNPVSAFGQPAMLLAIFGSLLTRRPLATAVTSIGPVLQATAQQDAAQARSAYEQWKVNSDQALRLYEIEGRMYESGLQKEIAGLNRSVAERTSNWRTIAAALKNPMLAQVIESHGVEGADGLARSYVQHHKEMTSNYDAADKHLSSQVDAVQARGDTAPVAAATTTAGKTGRPPDEDLEAQAFADPEKRPGVQALGIQLMEKDLRAQRDEKKASPDFQAKASQDLRVLADLRLALVSNDPERVEPARRQIEKIRQLPAGSLSKTLGPLSAAASKQRDTEVIANQLFEKDMGRPPGSEDEPVMAEYRQKAAAGVGVNILTPEAADLAARTWLRTNVIPVGFGGAPMRRQIMERGAQIAAAEGKTVDEYRAIAASQKADTSALAAVTKQKSFAEGYERGAVSEFDYMLTLIPKTPEPLNMQALTRWARTGETEFGDLDVPKWNAVLISALDEYAKVLSGSTGATGSTDFSRRTAEAMIPVGATSAQIPPIVDAIKRSMEYKIAGYKSQQELLRQSISQPESAPGLTPGSPAPGGGRPPPGHPDARWSGAANAWVIPSTREPGKWETVE